MKKIKKPVSIVLALMMVVSLFAIVPITASAAEETSTVTWGNNNLNNGGTGGMSSGGVTLTTQQAKTRVGDCFYSGRGSATFTAPEGSVFTKIEFKNCSDVNSLNLPGASTAQSGGYWQQDPWDDDPHWIPYYTVTWTGELSEVTFSGAIYGIQSIVFTLKSVAPPTYTVTWKNGDTVLETDTDVAKDAIPAYDGNVPTKAENEQYSYTFTGWTDSSNTFYSKDSNLPPVTKDETYTATFASEDKAVKNVIAQINALPAAAEITAADKAKIESARAAYDALNDGQKTLVTNLDKLTAAETALAAAENLFPQHSVTLGGDIGVNFFINSKTADFASDENAYVKFTWDNGTYNKEVKLKDLPRDNNGNYKATVDVVAAQMAHKIHAEVYLNGEKLDQTDDYSVQDYAEAVYNNPTAYDDKGKPRELQELAKALLNYGAQAQIVFDEYLVEKPAPANTVKTVGQTDFSGITAEQIKAAVNGEASNLNTAAAAFDAEFYTSSLIYLSRNTLRLYFTPASKTVGALDGKGFSGNLSDYYYYVEKENIAAAELDEQQSFTIGDKTFTFSALDYAKAVVNSDMGGNQKDLAKALYLYNKAANAYFDDAPAHVHTTATRQDNVVNATCTTAGSYDEVTYCSECNEVISTNHVDVPATGHTIVSVAEVPATTEAAGMAAHYECSVCHKLFSDAEGNNETTAEALVIPQIVENVVDLSTLTGAYEAKDGDVLSGILSGDKKITIADGATITLRDANITLSTNAQYAGITPVGDATILLEGKNTVKGGYENFPGVFVPVGKTLTIDGTGSLTASSGGNEDRKYSCGIGGGYEIAAGNIVINGGTITANGGDWAAGIGSGYEATCGNILIAGGTVTATGGESAAGIGSGLDSTCGNITIAGTVTQVTATKGEGAEASIGAGESGTCGTVTIEDNSKVTQN